MTGRTAGRGPDTQRPSVTYRMLGITASVLHKECGVTYARGFRIVQGRAQIRTHELVALYESRPMSAVLLVRGLQLTHDDVRVAALRAAAPCGCLQCKDSLPSELTLFGVPY